MSDSQAGSSIGGIFTGTLAFVLAILCFMGYAASFLVVDYIEGRIEEDCDSTTGTVIEFSKVDEGQCQDGRDTRDLVLSLQNPILLLGVVFVLIGGSINYQK